MNGNCTCGVQLVEGARFCHKCGRPVDGIEPMAALAGEEAPATPAVMETPAALAPPPLPVTVGFRNANSLRSALMSVAITFVPASAAAQLSPLLLFAGLMVNGLLGVLLFLRRSGRGMTTIEGARQGWISGLFFFGTSCVISTTTLLLSGEGKFSEIMREQAKAQGTLTPEISKVLNDPSFLAGMIFIIAVILFVLFTSLASIGGMLGARLFGSGNTKASEEPGSKLGM